MENSKMGKQAKRILNTNQLGERLSISAFFLSNLRLGSVMAISEWRFFNSYTALLKLITSSQNCVTTV